MLERLSQFGTLDISQDGRLLRVRLNRPESLNAVDSRMHRELEELWPLLRHDESVGAVLLTGAGRAFCAGGDVKAMAGNASSERNDAQAIGDLLHGARSLLTGMLDVEQPIVSAVQGYAMGLGATLALCSDVAIAADDAVFADTHTAIGLVAGDGGAVIWPLLLPINTAKYYLMTGERILGADAARLGLVVKSAPPDELESVAEELARRLAYGPTMAVKWTKLSVNKILRERLNLLFDESLLLEGASMLSDDHREATAAFVERRPPRYTGT